VCSYILCILILHHNTNMWSATTSQVQTDGSGGTSGTLRISNSGAAHAAASSGACLKNAGESLGSVCAELAAVVTAGAVATTTGCSAAAAGTGGGNCGAGGGNCGADAA
jgi:hypothetical protein